MRKKSRESQLKSKINTNEDLPVFSDAQINTFNSDYVDSLDKALTVLDETANPKASSREYKPPRISKN